MYLKFFACNPKDIFHLRGLTCTWSSLCEKISFTCVASHFWGRCSFHSQCWSWMPLSLHIHKGGERGSQELSWGPRAWQIGQFTLFHEKWEQRSKLQANEPQLCLYLETGFRFLMHRWDTSIQVYQHSTKKCRGNPHDGNCRFIPNLMFSICWLYLNFLWLYYRNKSVKNVR